MSAALVLGGIDVNGPALYSIYPHGSTDKLPYVTMGKQPCTVWRYLAAIRVLLFGVGIEHAIPVLVFRHVEFRWARQRLAY